MRFRPAIIAFVAWGCLAAPCAFAQSDDALVVPMEEYNNVPQGVLMPGTVVPAPVADKTAAPAENENALNMEDISAAYQQGKYDAIVKPLKSLANNNSPPAEELLGIMYRNGQGIGKDPAEALYWLMRAAEARRPVAEHHLASMSYLGEGIEKDAARALMWLHAAILHYPDGPDKQRAIQDRDNIYAQTTRRERARAKDLAREWLQKQGEEHLLDLNNTPD